MLSQDPLKFHVEYRTKTDDRHAFRQDFLSNLAYTMMNRCYQLLSMLLVALCASTTRAFLAAPSSPSVVTSSHPSMSLSATSNSEEDDDIVARRIVVAGDVQGGYYRACVLNEARRFRRLVGNMTPPDGSDRAEIYIEGKKKMVEGFVRWAQRGGKAIGLSQVVKVESVLEEPPNGLLDDFYVATK